MVASTPSPLSPMQSHPNADGRIALIAQQHEEEALREEAEKEARDEWMAELKEKELRIERKRAELMNKKREQMIESSIWREGWAVGQHPAGARPDLCRGEQHDD